MSENQWEQSGPGEDNGVTEILERYSKDEGIPAGGFGPGPDVAPDGDGASADSFGDVSQVVERVMERLGSELDRRLSSIRQDLTTHAERAAQSYSDKATARLTQRQREQLEMVERTLAPLRDQLGPDYDATLRQAKLDVVLGGNAQDAVGTPPAQTPAAPTGAESADQFAGVYLSKRLGDPRSWSADDTAAIHSELSQARDWDEWMAVVDRYAQRRPSGPQLGQSPQGNSAPPNIARAQPVGAPTGARPAASLAQLNAAYNRAVAEGDIDAMTKLGAQIDATLNKR